MSKTGTIILIVFLSIVTVGLISGLFLLIKFNFKFGKINIMSNLSNKLVEKKEITNIKDLNIKTDAVDVIIEEEDINSIKVELYSEKPKKHEISEEENQITVVLEDKTKTGFLLFKKTPNVKIYVPKDYDKNIVLNSNVGDVKIGNLKNATLKAKLDVGDVKIKNIKKADATLRVGDVKIDNIEKLTSDIKTGDLKIQNVNELTSKVKTGDVKIEKVDGFVNITDSIGDVKIQNAIITKNSKIKSNVGDVKIQTISGCYVEAKTNIGDVKVNNKERKSDIILNISDNVGDIKVNN